MFCSFQCLSNCDEQWIVYGIRMLVNVCGYWDFFISKYCIDIASICYISIFDLISKLYYY